MEHVVGDPVDIPKIDWSTVGQLGFAGNIAGLSRYQNTAQFESIQPNVSSILLQENGFYNKIASANGHIFATCLLDSADLFIGGNFTTIHNTSYSHIARFNLQTHTLSPLAQGLDGPVYALYCGPDAVYVGGEFGKPSSNAAIWNGSWVPVPWKGFNGPVYTIQHNPKTDTILFGGRFDATLDGQYLNTNTSQTVNMGAPTVVSSGNNALNATLGNADNIICPNSSPQAPGTPWLLENGVPGYWEAQFGHSIQPTVFRIANTHYEGKGTRTFSIVALGSNHYFDLSYVDPSTQRTVQCSTACFLSNMTTLEYQDFTVLHPISTNGIRIYIDSWYGTGGGLSNVEIFQSEAVVLPSLGGTNATQQCSSHPVSSTTIVGTWTEQYAYGYYQNVLTTSFPSSELASANVSVTYKPYIPAQGQYEVFAHTAGCVGSSTCGQRTQVEMILSFFPGIQQTITIDQTNAQDKLTLIYRGTIAATAGDFQPSVLLKVSPNATAPSGGIVSVIADAIQFVRNETSPPLSSILEFSPRNASISGTLAWRPLSQQLTPGSTVKTLDASSGDVLYIGGQFFGENNTYRNIVSYDYRLGGGQLVALPDIGLNGNVNDLLLVGSALFVGGAFNGTFTNTINLNHVAQFNVDNRTWQPLEAGLDGTVERIVLSSNNASILFSGPFMHYSQHPSSGNANWSLTASQWLEPSSLIVGSVASSYVPNIESQWITGDIRSAQTYRGDIIALDDKSAYPFIFDSDRNIINAGLFWNDTIILGGRFRVGNTSNLAIFENGTWSQIQPLFGEVYALAIHDNHLYIGGNFTGLSAEGEISSFAVYDLAKRVNVALPGIYAENGSPGSVNAIEIDPDSQTVYVGGNFAKAGSLNCASVCALQPSTLQWNTVANGLSGSVQKMSALNGQVIIAGVLQVNGQTAFIARLDQQKPAWNIANHIDIGLPTALLQGQDQQVYLAGQRNNSTYMAMWDGDSLTDLATLGPSSQINQLLYVPIASAPRDIRFPPGSQMMLLVAGHLNLDTFGNVSAALYDGISWYPFVLTSTLQGEPGVLRNVFHRSSCCTAKDLTHYLPVPAVILIAIASSMGILFLLVGAAVVGVAIRHRRAPDVPEPMPPWTPKAKAPLISPQDTLHDAGPSNFTAPPPVPPVPPPASSAAAAAAASAIGFGALMAAAAANAGSDVAPTEEKPKLMYAKYPFEAKELGELEFNAGDPIVVTDTSDNVWWIGAVDDGQGNEKRGVFPSNYVTDTKSV
ncbi:hypothetical protein EC973_006895 [Apophysomyces ossiformis]|uniref:SH3 domain-containing protein n=1 Tax=Apophysomyces ossiformis TaxID=679940 RepID=A0A8H7BMV7_9FUNG|nr:hypothetical protein EC973_006895 [Apophysomyces ossiformis]